MDVYVEQFVERIVTQKDNMIKTVLSVSCVVLGILAFLSFSPLFFVVFLAMGLYTYIYTSKLGCLMEYVFNGEELVVTRMTTNRRKKIYACKMERVLSVCHHTEYSAPGQETKDVKDFSSGILGDETYIMIVSGDKGKQKVFFEPDQEMLQAMRRIAPSVVRVLPKYGR